MCKCDKSASNSAINVILILLLHLTSVIYSGNFNIIFICTGLKKNKTMNNNIITTEPKIHIPYLGIYRHTFLAHLEKNHEVYFGPKVTNIYIFLLSFHSLVDV